MPHNLSRKSLNIGFISFRFAGTDGVSLETTKWADVLEEMGHSCFYFSGLSDRPGERSMVVEEAHFLHPETREHFYRFFGTHLRKTDDTLWIHKMREYYRRHLDQFLKKFDIDLLIPENALSFPLNIPLSMALTELIAETNIPTIAHHHDFTWERKDLLVTAIQDYISMAVPPILPSIQHVVINTHASHQMARRTGVSSTIVPNVMNFEKAPPKVDEYSADLRETIGLEEDEFFILQPTRVVQRKGIEHAVELVSRLGLKARLIISHASGDDGYGYEKRIREYADLMDVRAIFSSKKFDENRRMTRDGEKVYSLWDAYPHADLVTYPSEIEGFGNAFLEALYFKKPIVVNNYAIYETDIKPKGFKVIEFNEYITDKTIDAVRNILQEPRLAKEMCNYNYKLAQKHYSYKVLRGKLRILLNNAFGINHMP